MAKRAAGAKAPVKPKPPALQLIRADTVQPEEMEFLWMDRIPKGTLTLIGGRPGMGKSLFSTYLAAEVTKAGGAVIMSNPEDALAWVKMPRLIAAGADPRLVHFWPGKMNLPGAVEELEQFVNFHGVKLVTIDPIAKHIRSSDPNTALEPLVQMCERTGVAAVGVHHLNKRIPKDAHPQEAFGGAAGGWLGTARYAHVLGPVGSGEEDGRYMAMVKSNHGAMDTPAIEFYIDEAEVDLNDGQVIETGRLVFVNASAKVSGEDVVQYKGGVGFKHQAGGEKLAVAVEFLTLLLMRGPVKAKDVFEKGVEVGVSKMTLRRAAEELSIVKTRVGYGPGSHIEWRLPDGHPALAMVPSKGGAKKDVDEGDIDEALRKILGGKG